MSTTISQLPPTLRDDELPSRQAPRRTYGRQRELSPSDDVPTTSLFRPSSETSPAKGLLNRWSAANTSWKDSLPMLGSEGSDATDTDVTVPIAGPSRDTRATLTDFATREGESKADALDVDNDDEDDMEAIKREMDRMRREARGVTTAATVKGASTAPIKSSSLAVPATHTGLPFGSSSLTSLPTSSPKSNTHALSSPKILASQALSLGTEEKTIPIRRSGVAKSSGRRPRIVASDSEDDEDANETIQRIASPQLRSSPPLTGSSPRSRSPVSPSPRRSKPNYTRALSRKSASPDENYEDAPLESMQDFFATLQEDDKEAAGMSTAEVMEPGGSSFESLGLFDDEEVNAKGKDKNRKPKPLNKKDLKLMQSGLAENRRNRAVEISKPEVTRLPISSWMAMASSVISGNKGVDVNRSDVPGLSFGGRDSSPATSPAHKTPSDEIAAFTPSSDKRRLGVKDSVTRSKIFSDPASSSPTPHIAKSGLRTITHHDEDEDEAIPSFTEMMAQEDLRVQKEKEKQAAVERLRARKAAALKAIRASHNSDDDFEILPDEPAPAPPISTKAEPSQKRFPDAKAILKKSDAVPAISKNKQALLRRAGKLAKVKGADVTETYFDFAGKAFDHANMKRSNGGAVPAGQKQGRDLPPSITQIHQQLMAQHRQQVLGLQKKREEDWGKTRILPQRRQQDYSALIEASAQAPVKDESDEEEDDEDFVPDGEDDEEVGNEDEGESVQYSGEDEDEGDDEDDAEVDGDENAILQEDASDTATDKENKPENVDDEEEDIVPVIRRKPRASIRVAFDSDEEGDKERTPRASIARPPLAEVPEPSPTYNSGGFDLAGFDGGSGSPGFSQLFEATQAGEALEESDAFANIRDRAPFALMPANALLPGVDISETQAARDNALIAAEVDAAMDDMPAETQPKQKYLNEQGFFTQTRPAAFVPTQRYNDETQMSSSRRQLAGASDFSMMDDSLSEAQQGQMPSSTEKGTSALRTSSPGPTQDAGKLTRLRYRSSPDPEDLLDPEPTQTTETRNAFDRMMKASKRVEKRAEERRAAVNSNLVDVQAEESDEDGGWAPIGGGVSDDESGDENDGYVPDLVDDQAIDDEEKKRQDDLAAAKAREIEAADDAKREAEARKITEGQYRTKKRGLEFYSDDEDDEEGGGRRRKWSKRERRKRRLEKEDGLDKLDGEANVFRQAYEEDLISDTETVDDESLPQRDLTPEPESLGTLNKPTWFILRERAKLNRGKDLVREADDLDREIGFDGSGFKSTSVVLDEEEDVVMDLDDEESQFSIKRSIRSTTSINLEDDPLAARRLGVTRSTDVYAQYLREESQTNRRGVGVGAVSVTSYGNTARSNSGGFKSGSFGQKSYGPKPPARQGSGSSSGSILMSKSNRFA